MLWLCTVPRLVFAAPVQGPSEQAASTTPILEGEDLFEAVVEMVRSTTDPDAQVDLNEALQPPWVDRFMRIVHGPVAHPPPWGPFQR